MGVKLSAREVAILDALRANLTRSAYLRALVVKAGQDRTTAFRSPKPPDEVIDRYPET